MLTQPNPSDIIDPRRSDIEMLYRRLGAYEVLGLPDTASDDNIVDAYRRVAHATYPETTVTAIGDADRFRRAHLAYVILSDPGMRAAYDRGDFCTLPYFSLDVIGVSEWVDFYAIANEVHHLNYMYTQGEGAARDTVFSLFDESTGGPYLGTIAAVLADQDTSDPLRILVKINMMVHIAELTDPNHVVPGREAVLLDILSMNWNEEKPTTGAFLTYISEHALSVYTSENRYNDLLAEAEARVLPRKIQERMVLEAINGLVRIGDFDSIKTAITNSFNSDDQKPLKTAMCKRLVELAENGKVPPPIHNLFQPAVCVSRKLKYQIANLIARVYCDVGAYNELAALAYNEKFSWLLLRRKAQGMIPDAVENSGIFTEFEQLIRVRQPGPSDAAELREICLKLDAISRDRRFSQFFLKEWFGSSTRKQAGQIAVDGYATLGALEELERIASDESYQRSVRRAAKKAVPQAVSSLMQTAASNPDQNQASGQYLAIARSQLLKPRWFGLRANQQRVNAGVQAVALASANHDVKMLVDIANSTHKKAKGMNAVDHVPRKVRKEAKREISALKNYALCDPSAFTPDKMYELSKARFGFDILRRREVQLGKMAIDGYVTAPTGKPLSTGDYQRLRDISFAHPLRRVRKYAKRRILTR